MTALGPLISHVQDAFDEVGVLVHCMSDYYEVRLKSASMLLQCIYRSVHEKLCQPPEFAEEENEYCIHFAQAGVRY